MVDVVVGTLPVDAAVGNTTTEVEAGPAKAVFKAAPPPPLAD